MNNSYVSVETYGDLEIEIISSAYDYSFENEYAVNVDPDEGGPEHFSWYEYLYGTL